MWAASHLQTYNTKPITKCTALPASCKLPVDLLSLHTAVHRLHLCASRLPLPCGQRLA